MVVVVEYISGGGERALSLSQKCKNFENFKKKNMCGEMLQNHRKMCLNFERVLRNFEAREPARRAVMFV